MQFYKKAVGLIMGISIAATLQKATHSFDEKNYK